jgi:2,4-dienoyl-CoA reductase (NADPH2)
MMPGCDYSHIDDQGLHITVDDDPQVLDVDSIIVCAGQDPLRELVDGLNLPHHLIGGADEAGELDAKRAINQGTRLAAAM